MVRIIIGLVALGFLIGLSHPTAHAHPVHVSVGEVRWNPEKNRMEFSVRVRPRDLEQTLKSERWSGPDGARRDGGNPKGPLLAWLRHNIVVEVDSKAQVLQWLGQEHEERGSYVWLHFAYRLPEGVTRVTLTNRAFFDLEDDQVNVLLLLPRGSGGDVTLEFTGRTPSCVLELKDLPRDASARDLSAVDLTNSPVQSNR